MQEAKNAKQTKTYLSFFKAVLHRLHETFSQPTSCVYPGILLK